MGPGFVDPDQTPEPTPLDENASDFICSSEREKRSFEYIQTSDFQYTSDKIDDESPLDEEKPIIEDLIDFGAESGYKSETSLSEAKIDETQEKSWEDSDYDKGDMSGGELSDQEIVFKPSRFTTVPVSLYTETYSKA